MARKSSARSSKPLPQNDEGAKREASKRQLLEHIGILSELECERLAPLILKTAYGDRFWEQDAGLFYNEYVKVRYSHYVRNPEVYTPTVSVTANGPSAALNLKKDYKHCQRIPLPDSAFLGAQLSAVMRERRSIRRGDVDHALSLHEVATLLCHGAGITGNVSSYGFSNVPLRTFPSSGGLQSTELYLVSLKVMGLNPGIFHINPEDNCLELIKAGDFTGALTALTPGQPDIEHASAVVIYSGCYNRLRWKYGARSYRYMCMDIGFAAENLYLAASAMGIGFCAVAGFIDDEIERLIEIDGDEEMALLVGSLC